MIYLLILLLVAFFSLLCFLDGIRQIRTGRASITLWQREHGRDLKIPVTGWPAKIMGAVQVLGSGMILLVCLFFLLLGGCESKTAPAPPAPEPSLSPGVTATPIRQTVKLPAPHSKHSKPKSLKHQ